MLDTRILRNDPEALSAGLARRGEAADVERLVSLDEKHRRLLVESERLKAERNTRSKEIGSLIQAGEADEAEALKAEMREVAERIKALDEEAETHKATLDALMLEIPNLPHDDVPAGGPESNVTVREWGEPRTFDFEPKAHWDLGPELGVLEFERAAKMAGSGFVGLVGHGAALARALVSFMLDTHRGNGYLELAPPYLVNPETATATGHLPKFADQLYHAEVDDLYLIPTAEVPIMGWHRNEILEDLPRRYVAYTPCFRREAGAHGRETRGLIRVHQFDKVELFQIVEPEVSYEVLESLTADAEGILEALDLPYRRVLLAAGDMGNAAAKTYDLEVWAPGCEMWLEDSSCSNCEDYQSRRAMLRARSGEGGTYWPHTLNGSGLALPRTVIAILENYQDADGSVTVPEVLRSYMGGLERIAAPE